MVAIASTLPVDLSRAQLWEGLKRKAVDPVPFVPAITACTILERYSDGLLREIVVRDTDRHRERVVFEPTTRVVFEQLTDPQLATITNEIEEDGTGGLRLTLTVALSPEGIARAQREPQYLAESRDFFAGTLRAIVDTLHRTTVEPVRGTAS